ncbi:MAG TPA: DUF192 domain-containing protein [Burkholderiales bacterium]|nr:DUF192 domain-containing protein [Burkholderiales bacterium]HYA46395.1 DUF192 domain-containing protein [Burkholderiales bacterium]
MAERTALCGKAGATLPFSFLLRPAALFACVLAPLLALPAQAQQAQLPEVQLTAGVNLIHAELADDFPSRMQGLMYRASLAPNGGMLFVFDKPDTQCMWMKNTLVPLSVAFISDGGTIVNIADMQPQTEDPHCAVSPVRYALEMEQGWFARHGFKPGMRLGGLDKLPR